MGLPWGSATGLSSGLVFFMGGADRPAKHPPPRLPFTVAAKIFGAAHLTFEAVRIRRESPAFAFHAIRCSFPAPLNKSKPYVPSTRLLPPRFP